MGQTLRGSSQTDFRRKIALSGVLGLLGCGAVAAVCAWLVASGRVKVWLPYPWATLLFALLLGGVSLAEVPLMVFAMRRLAVERPDNVRIVLGLNAFYVFFAAVYGAPVILLTGSIGLGLTICGLGIIRWLASLLFTPSAPVVMAPPGTTPASADTAPSINDGAKGSK